MSMSDALLTSADVARMLGVGATSVKRWNAAGLLRCERTAGGHRRFLRSEVERFRADHQDQLAPDPTRVEEWIQRILIDTDPYDLHSALLADRARLGTWWRVAENLGAVLTEVGVRWRAGRITVLEEHLASERLARGLSRCVEAIAVPRGARRVLLATPPGDEHTLGLNLVELAFRERGWSSLWAGRGVPLSELAERVRSGACQCVALSASESSSDADALMSCARHLAEVCAEQHIPLVIGGRGAWPDSAVGAAGFRRVRDLRELSEHLAELRD
jgi:excisionase family DNA binding protein